jgi:sulfate adenylyltransferase subunit 2
MRFAYDADDGAVMSSVEALATEPQHAASRLERLESESVYILRDLASFERVALMFSGGKDSAVLLHLAMKAYAPQRPPFTLLHIDTGHNFPDVLTYRDRRAEETVLKLVVRSVEDSIARGSVRLARDASRNAAQAVTLLEAQQEFGFDAMLGGARRDEEKARAKERVFSHRDAYGAWRPREQRPELWNLYNRRLAPGEHMRVFPLSNWTEADVWAYIAQEKIALPDLYYTHERDVVRRDGLLFPITEITPAGEGDFVERLSVRFRTVGDISCTCPVESGASTPEQILLETLAASASERGATRLDDRANSAAMERRKLEGYF